MASANNFTLGSLIRRVLVVDLILSAMAASANSLALFMGGEAIGASQPATIGAAVTGWIVQFIAFGVIQGIFMTIFTLVIAFIVGALFRTADEKQSAALTKAFRWGGRIVFTLAALIAVYSGFVQYGLFSAAHADPTLNLVATILTSLLTFVYGSFVLGFIGLIGTIVLSVFAVALSGGFKIKKDEKPATDGKTDEKTDAK